MPTRDRTRPDSVPEGVAPPTADPSIRVLFVTPRYAPFIGGIETHVAEVSRRMIARGHEVTVLTVDPDGTLPPTEDRDGVRILRVPSSGGDLYWSPALYRAIRAGSWDVIHVQGVHTTIPLLAMLAARWSRTPYLLTFHTGGHDSRIRIRLRWLQWLVLAPLLRSAADLVAVSRFESDLWHHVPGLARARIEVIANGAGVPAPEPPLTPDPNLVVSVGRLVRYKGHQRVLAAFAELLATRPAARLRIAGAGPREAELRRLAGRLGVASRVEIAAIPGTDRAGMGRLLAQAGVVVLLSEYEAHPVVVMEAASLGRPVLAAETTGLTELVAAGLARGVPLAASPAAVARAMCAAMEGPPPIRAPLPRWDDCADALMDRYRAILHQP